MSPEPASTEEVKPDDHEARAPVRNYGGAVTAPDGTVDPPVLPEPAKEYGGGFSRHG